MRSNSQRTFRLLFTITTLLQATFAAVKVLITYRVLGMGGGVGDIGALVAFYSLAPLLLAVQIGRFVDRGHIFLTASVGAGAAAAGVIVITVGPNLIVLGIGSVLIGFGQMASMIAAQGLIPRLGTPDDLDRQFGWWTVAVSLGQTLGLPLSGIVVAMTVDHDNGIRLALIGLIVLSTVATVLSLLPAFRRIPAATPDARPDDGQQPILAMLRTPGMTSAIFGSVVVMASIDLVAAYMPVVGVERGFGLVVVTVLLSARAVSSLVARLLMSHIRARISRKWILIASPAISAVMMLVLAFAGHEIILGAALVVAGFVWGLAQPMSMTWVAGLVSPRNRASALSLRLTGNRIGQVAVPLAAGSLAAAAGVAAIFIGIASLLAVSAFTTASAYLEPRSRDPELPPDEA